MKIQKLKLLAIGIAVFLIHGAFELTMGMIQRDIKLAATCTPPPPPPNPPGE